MGRPTRTSSREWLRRSSSWGSRAVRRPGWMSPASWNIMLLRPSKNTGTTVAPGAAHERRHAGVPGRIGDAPGERPQVRDRPRREDPQRAAALQPAQAGLERADVALGGPAAPERVDRDDPALAARARAPAGGCPAGARRGAAGSAGRPGSPPRWPRTGGWPPPPAAPRSGSSRGPRPTACIRCRARRGRWESSSPGRNARATRRTGG